MVRRCVRSRNLKNEEAMARGGQQRHRKKERKKNGCVVHREGERRMIMQQL